MTKQNIDHARAGMDAVNRGDFKAAFADITSDFEFDFSRSSGPMAGVYDAGGMRAVSDELDRTWEAIRYEVTDYIAKGEHVVVPFTGYFTGRDGIEVTARAAWLMTYRDGLLERICLHDDREQALAAIRAEPAEPG